MAKVPIQWLSTSRGKLVALLSLALVMVVLLVSVMIIPKTKAASFCAVTYAVTSQWMGSPNGFNVQSIGIQNTSGSAWTSWTLTFTFPAAGQTVGAGPWGGTFTQSGQNVTVTNLSYNGNVANNASVNPAPGFNGTWTTSNPVPTNFAVNGNACGGSGGGTPTSTATRTGSTPTSTPTQPAISPTSTPISGANVGNATWFSALGQPYGGCGVPQPDLDSQNFVALNVQNTPGDYSTFLPRPIPAADASKIGFFNNGLNCDRWVKVTIGNFCTGTNDGAPNQPFCRNGSWVADKYNGATLDMLVADSCQDGNAWCRDDPNHLDLAQGSLNSFVLNGQPVGDMYPNHWNNRQISWQFEPAPNYSGDIKLGFLQSANPYWSPIDVTHLANGIHGVDYFQNGAWVKATTDSDMGDAYLILPTTTAGSQYQIRVYDVNGQLINNGRVYNFSFPASCGSSCPTSYTPVTYTTS
jgi:hypothetical protein